MTAELLQSGPFISLWVSLGVFLAIITGMIVFSYKTQAGNVAVATTKEAIRQPVFYLMLFIAIVLLGLNTWVPFFTLGEDVKMLKDCGLMTILVSSLLLAVWTSSTSIAAEIEGKTAMTLLSKPVNRRQFVVGKFVGILQAVLIMIMILGAVFLALIYYKVAYDAREKGGGAAVETVVRLIQVIHIVPGLLLLFLEVAVLTAISVAISTRLPMVVNIVSCFAVFVIGHLTAILVVSGKLKLEFVEFMARLIATILPSLEAFNMQAAVATERVVPWQYLGLATAYCAAYCGAAILAAFISFEDRDLA